VVVAEDKNNRRTGGGLGAELCDTARPFSADRDDKG